VIVYLDDLSGSAHAGDAIRSGGSEHRSWQVVDDCRCGRSSVGRPGGACSWSRPGQPHTSRRPSHHHRL